MDIGIDLGTTFSVIAVKGKQSLREDYPGGKGQYIEECDVTIIPSHLAELTIPSVFWQDRDDEQVVLVGTEAKDKARDGDAPIMFSKRAIGTTRALKLHDRAMSAKEVATHVLKYIKDCAEQATGQPVRRAVITHPAYFDRSQIEETREAAIAAGFDMSLRDHQMMMEPAAAALAYLQSDPKDPLTILTYDLGGGTFDVTVLERSLGVSLMKGFDGDPLFGGYNFDRKLVEWALAKIKASGREVPYDDSNPEDRGRRAQLLQLAENIKIELSKARSAKVPVTVKIQGVLVDAAGRSVQFLDKITREEYASLLQEDLNNTVACCHRALAKAKIEAERLDYVLLVGGSTYAQWVQEAVEQAFPGKVKVFNPDLCVAAGAALQAAELPAVASSAGLELILNLPTTSPLPTVTVSGSVRSSGVGGAQALADLRVLLHTPQKTLEAAVTEGGGGFLFEDIPLRSKETTRFTIEVADRTGRKLIEKAADVTFTPEGGTAATISTSLPKPLFLKTADGLKPIAEEGVALPAKCEAVLKRAWNEASLEIPVYQGEEEIGKVAVTNIPPDAGEGARVVLTVEINEMNAMSGTVRVMNRTGTSVAAEMPVYIKFPPLVVPEVSELRAQFADLEAKREQDLFESADPEQRLRLKGPGEKLARSVNRLLSEQSPDPQEVHRAIKELGRLVNPPADDLEPPRLEFSRIIEECRQILHSRPGERQLEPFRSMLDQIERDGNQAAITKNHKKWGQINDGLIELQRRLRVATEPSNQNAPPPRDDLPPTPLLKDHFRQRVDAMRAALLDQRDALSRKKDYEIKVKERCDILEAEIDKMEKDIDRVEETLEARQALSQLQIVLRAAAEFPRRLRALEGDVF